MWTLFKTEEEKKRKKEIREKKKLMKDILKVE